MSDDAITAELGESTAVRMLLDGLEVESIRELKRLVDVGRGYESRDAVTLAEYEQAKRWLRTRDPGWGWTARDSQMQDRVDEFERSGSAERRYMEDRGGIQATAIGLARLALSEDDTDKARRRLDEACDELHRLHWDACLADGNDPEKIEMLLGPRDRKTVTEVKGDRYERGFVDGLAAYAWWKDGVQYVGTTGTTLKDATAKARETWNFYPERSA